MKMLAISNPETLKAIRQNILRCVSYSVSELLQEPEDSICANLLAISSLEGCELTVVARSDPHRDTGLSVQRNDHPQSAWKAIENGTRFVEDDFQETSRLHGLGKTPYRSIFVIPVTSERKAYGVLSIDSTAPYVFLDRETEMEFLLQPYLAILQLTFPPKSSSYVCDYSMPRH